MLEDIAAALPQMCAEGLIQLALLLCMQLEGKGAKLKIVHKSVHSCSRNCSTYLESAFEAVRSDDWNHLKAPWRTLDRNRDCSTDRDHDD